MAAKKKLPPDQTADSKTAEKDSNTPKTDIENFADDKESDLYNKCLKFYKTVHKQYENQKEADESCKEYWNIYNASPDENQSYQGNSQCYVPVVRNAINGRSKRALKQLFPSKFTHVDAVGADGDKPYPQLALLEHYIRSTKLKCLVRSLLVAGDVTGQWTIYIDWKRSTHHVTNMIRRNPAIQSLEGELSDPESEVEELEDAEIIEDGPVIVDIATEDVCVVPPTCNDIDKADLVCVKLRMGKAQVQEMIDAGIFLVDDDTELSDWMDVKKGKESGNPAKDRADDAGVKTEGTNSFALIYEVTAYVEFEKGKKSLAYVYFAGENDCIGIIRAPQWGQKRPIISAPVDRVSGSYRGVSKIEAVKRLQWNTNDYYNMGQDSAMYSLLPIVMTDPEKNPNYAMMVYGLAAVWPVNPDTTKFQSFPQLWKDAMQMCAAIKEEIHESLDVNPMMMGKMPNGRKNAGAVGAQQQEQSIPILDHAERFEEEILDPLMERIFEYDAQFREEDLTVLSMGELGAKAAMMTIEPMHWGNRFYFKWTGTEQVMNMQRMQQQIATMNVLRGIPPQQMNGLKLDITPILQILADNVFGAELSSRILIDDRNKYTIPPEVEDEMLINGIHVHTHEADDDMKHIQSHQQAAQMSGDPTGLKRTHIQRHMKQMEEKRQKAAGAQQPQQGMPGVPGGAGPGVPGAPPPGGGPRMGAQPAPQRPMQQPPGSQPMPQ